VFFDVENTSRPEHIARVIQHIALDWQARGTELVAVGNWRVIGHETARLLAQRGAHLVHSAPSVGVRDWSDLRIAVAAGVWLAGARPGDVLEIVTDDQAFDAVGDVAASLGVGFRRLSYRALAGIAGELPAEEAAGGAPRSSRRGRGRRRSSWREGQARQPTRHEHAPAPAPVNGTTAPHDEILFVVQELLSVSPAGITLDALSNALKARGFRRPPGSPRLITRLHRIKELTVNPGGMIRLVDGGEPPPAVEVEPADAQEPPATTEAAPSPEAAPGANGAPRRRRRRGGRRRRGRGQGVPAPAPPEGGS
jgi:hypothetical protein